MIAVDRACRFNRRPNLRAAMGVFVGDNSPYNTQRVLHGVRTNQGAELMAGESALH